MTDRRNQAVMDAAEIARLWEINDGFGRPDAQRSRLTVGEVLALLDALEQARKELAGAKEDIQGWHELWGEYNRTGSELSDMLAERDAAQQSAKDARALLRKVLKCLTLPMGSTLRARIEAFLEPKV